MHIPLAGRVAASYAGHRITATPEVAAIFGPSGPAVLEHWPADSPQLCLRIDEQVLTDRLQERLDAAVVSPVEFEYDLQIDGPAVRGWLSALRILAAELEQPGGLAAQPVLAAEIQQLIVLGLLMCQQHNHSEAVRTPGAAPRPKAVQLVTDLIRGQPDRPWTVPQLATAAGSACAHSRPGFAATSPSRRGPTCVHAVCSALMRS